MTVTINDFDFGKLKNPEEWQTEGSLTIYGRVVEVQDRAFTDGETFTNLRMVCGGVFLSVRLLEDAEDRCIWGKMFNPLTGEFEEVKGFKLVKKNQRLIVSGRYSRGMATDDAGNLTDRICHQLSVYTADRVHHAKTRKPATPTQRAKHLAKLNE